MTTIINTITTTFITSTPYSAISNGMAVISVLLLLAILVEKVLLDAYEDQATERRTLAFLVVIVPFSIVLVVVIYLRMAQILEL
jgi:hypothetical protein